MSSSASDSRSGLLRVLVAGGVTLAAPVVTTAAQPEADATLQTVVVTAQRLGADLEREVAVTPGAVTLIDGQALQQRGVTHLADVLRQVPGVFAESYSGTDEVFYSSRGSNLDSTDYDRNGIRFFQDGLPLTAADGNNHNRGPDPLNARFVTVAHGANALAYGASTLGGAIDFTTPTARDTAPRVALSGGSFGQWGAHATLSEVAGNFDGLVTLATQQRDGYRRHSQQDRRNVHANLGWRSSANVSTRLYGAWSDYSVELPREISRAALRAEPRAARPDALLGDHRKDLTAWRVAFKTTASQFAGGTFEIGASHERQSLFHPIVSTPFFSLLIDTDHRDTATMLRFRRQAGTHDVTLGANLAWSSMRGGNFQNLGGARGDLMYPTDDRARSVEVHALDRWRFAPRWTLVYGAQFAHGMRDVGGFDATYNAVNPRVGLIRDFGRAAQWFASAGRIHEAPTTYELTDDLSGGTHALDAMHGLGVESGLRGETWRGVGQLHWHVTAYYNALRDEILSVDDPAAPGTSLSTNIPRTTHAGVEALFGGRFTLRGPLRLEPVISATYNAFNFDDHASYHDNRLASAPRWFARGEVMLAHVAGFSAGPTFDFVGPRHADFANSYRVGTYGLLGARALVEAGRWQFFIEGRNLLDRRHAATVLARDVAASDAQVLFPGAPRSVHLGAAYDFQSVGGLRRRR